MAETKTKPKAKTKPANRKTGDKAQYERFREFAREVEADDDADVFDATFRKIVPGRRVNPKAGSPGDS